MRYSDKLNRHFMIKTSPHPTLSEVARKAGVGTTTVFGLLGFDDFELASMFSPSISVIQQPVEEIGRQAAEAPFNQLRDERGTDMYTSSKHIEQIRLRTLLVRRGSCGCNSADRFKIIRWRLLHCPV